MDLHEPAFPFSLCAMLIIAEPYRPHFAALGLNSVEAMGRFFLGTITVRKASVLVHPATLPQPNGPDLTVFYKQYEYPTPAWRFVGRPSKARCEFENYAVFRRLQLSTAEPLAAGEERDALGRLRRACIVTRAVPDALSLPEYCRQRVGDRSNPEVRGRRREIIRQLAAMTRTIHQAGFFHNDLLWRNVLVNHPSAAGPQLWWIDCPRGKFVRWAPLRRHRRVKDLASLDKPAGQWCTRGERVLFIKEYLGLKRLDDEARGLIRRTLKYRKRRWPEDWIK